MLNKAWKTIQQENGKIEIFGNNHDIELTYETPDWSEDLEQCFKYKGNTYFLSEFMNIHNKVYNPNPVDWMKEFSGYMNDSAFSGILIKLSECGEAVKAYTFIAS